MTIETKNNSLSFDLNLPRKINEFILILNNLRMKKITLKTSWISVGIKLLIEIMDIIQSLFY